MVSPLGNPAATTVVAKKAAEKKEEKKPEEPQKPSESFETKKTAEGKKSEASSDKPKAENAGGSKETKQEDPTTFTGALDSKTVFEVSQRIGKPKNPNAGEPADKQKDDPKKPNASEPADKQKADPKKLNGGEPAAKEKDDPRETKEKDKKDMAEGLLEKFTGKPDKTDKPNKSDKPEKDDEKKPDKPEKMTTRGSLDTLIEKDNAGLKKLDVAKDKIKNEKDDPEGDGKISTEDIDLALGKKGYLTKEEAEAAKHLRDSGAWDDINGKDSKATTSEIIQYRNKNTSPDDAKGNRPKGKGQDKIESDGKVDNFKQEGKGSGFLAPIVGLSKTEEGQKIIDDTITKNDDGSYSVKFKGDGSGKTYTVTEEMIAKNQSSTGDDDVKILTEGMRQYFSDRPLAGPSDKDPLKEGTLNDHTATWLLTGEEPTERKGNSFDKLDTAESRAAGDKEAHRDNLASTDDLDAAIKDKKILGSDEERDAAKTLRDSDAWDEINGKDSKASSGEILDWAKKNPDTKEAKAINLLFGDTEKENGKMIEDYKKNPEGSVLTFSANDKSGTADPTKGNGEGNFGFFTVVGIEGDEVTYISSRDTRYTHKMSVDDLMKSDSITYTGL